MATMETIPSKGKASQFACTRYQFFLDAPFEISNQCCRVMKKNPSHTYSHQTGRHPMTAEMASESRLRMQSWIQNGCNGFDMKEPKATPMIFWLEQDILTYIQLHGDEMVRSRKEEFEKEHDWTREEFEEHYANGEWGAICSVYGDIVADEDNQLTLSDISEDKELFDLRRPSLHTTGCNRTGCVFCGFGCHLEHESYRFLDLKETHPKLHDYILRPWKDGGLGYKEVIDWINSHGGFNIKY